MKTATDNDVSGGIRTTLTALPRRFVGYFWRKIFLDASQFYKNTLLFKCYFAQHENARAAADAPPCTQDLAVALTQSPGCACVDYDKIKSVGGVSLKYYEAGAFYTRRQLNPAEWRRNKSKFGAPIHPASWSPAPAPDGADSGPGTDHSDVCLAIFRKVPASFALQLFHVFICFLYLRSLRRQGYRVECLLLDSARDKLSELYTTCLPNCHFPEERAGVHRFPHLLNADLSGWDGVPWRQMLYTCGLLGDFHRFVLSAFGVAPPAPSRHVGRITLIRREQHTASGGKPCIDRVIKNEEEVIAALTRHYQGVEFQAVYFERLPLREQLRLFTRSDVIVSMHGAGLIAGACFAPPNAGIVELFPKYYRTASSAVTCRAISHARGLHYRRWLNHRRANEFGSDAQPALRRHERYYRNPVRQNSLTRVPPAAVIRRINQLTGKIKRAR